MVTYERDIKYYETDRMGFVHNSNYIRMFEEGRLYHIGKTAEKYTEIEKLGFLSPVVSQSIKYHRPLYYGEIASIQIKLVEFNGIRYRYQYSIYEKESGELSAEGTSEHCFIEKDTRRPVNVRRSLPELYEKMRASLETE